jgi:hypothetical protein
MVTKLINYPIYGFVEAGFADDLVGKSFTIIQCSDVMVGDVLIDFQCTNFAHQRPVEIIGVKPVGDFTWLKWGKKLGRRYSNTCLFGKLRKE